MDIRTIVTVLMLVAVMEIESYPGKRSHSPAGPSFVNGRPRKGFIVDPPPPAANFQPAPDLWFDQKLNHFDDADLRRWKQRYFVNASSFRPGGPVFVNIGGEGRLSPLWVAVGHMVDLATKYGALVLSLEHRFYGDSHPLGDLTDDSLQYLSSEQALADLAEFRNAMVSKFHLSKENKWVMFGGSYPGALSAWFRLKYPHLTIGSIASSAPIFAQLDFPQYLEVVTRSLAGNSAQGLICVRNVDSAVKKLEKMVKTQEGLNNLSEIFNVCKDTPLSVENEDDISMFAQALAGNFFGVVQYNKDNRHWEGGSGANITIDTLCGIMNNASFGDALHRYAQVNKLISDVGNEECLNPSYKDFVKEMQQTSYSASAAEGGRQWLYQTCTEFGYYQTTDSSKQVFGTLFPLSISVQQCMDIFGIKFNKSNINRGISRTNTNYGGYDLTASKIVFPNGSIDPWHALSFVTDPSPGIHAIYIEGTAHCANMYPSSPQDLPSLVRARQQINDVIGEWLQKTSSS